MDFFDLCKNLSWNVLEIVFILLFVLDSPWILLLLFLEKVENILKKPGKSWNLEEKFVWSPCLAWCSWKILCKDALYSLKTSCCLLLTFELLEHKQLFLNVPWNSCPKLPKKLLFYSIVEYWCLYVFNLSGTRCRCISKKLTFFQTTFLTRKLGSFGLCINRCFYKYPRLGENILQFFHRFF